MEPAVEEIHQEATPPPSHSREGPVLNSRPKSLPRVPPMRNLESPGGHDHTSFLVDVPGTTTQAYISRQVLLTEIASSLGLAIHSHGTLKESDSEIRGWLLMDVPPGRDQIRTTRRSFYGDIASTTYTAMEDAAQTAITHLLSFGDMLTPYAASMKEGHENILSEIRDICIEHEGFLPVEVSRSSDHGANIQNISVKYLGDTTPMTPTEKIAAKLAELASRF